MLIYEDMNKPRKEWMCPKCAPGDTWVTGDGCTKCSDVVDDCIECDGVGNCVRCLKSHFLVEEFKACVPKINNCKDDSTDYAFFIEPLDDEEDGYDLIPYCQNCIDDYFFKEVNGFYGCHGRCEEEMPHCDECQYDKTHGLRCLECENGYMIELGGYGCSTYIQNCAIPVKDQPMMLPNDEYDYYCPECAEGTQMIHGQCMEIKIDGCVRMNQWYQCEECQEGW